MRFILPILLFFASFTMAYAEKRVGLVIGNSNYVNTSPLTNPKNDSDDIAARLKKLGFEVIEGQNLDRRGFDEKLSVFGRAIQEADVALFFYAGHGMQYGGQNYLMPVDAKIQDEFSLRFEMTRMDDVMNVINSSRSSVKMIILDACRDNPLALTLAKTGTRSAVGKGFSAMEKSSGMIVAYATQANQVAQDGVERNSPFTKAFLKHIDEDNLEVGTFFRRVAADVNKATKGSQTPELSVSMLGEFYFKKAETDSQAWSKLRVSASEADLKAFQARFPNSPFVDAAQSKLQVLARDKKDRAEEERAKAEAEAKLVAAEKARLARVAALKAELEALSKGDAAVTPTQAAVSPVIPVVVAPPSVAPLVAAAVAPLVVAAAPALIPAPAKVEPPKPVTAPAPVAIPTPVVVAALPPQPLTPPAPAAPAIDGKVVIGIKAELKRLGCYFGRSDENWNTPQMKAGLAAFARETKVEVVSLSPQPSLLDTLKKQTARICPLTCGNGEVKRGDTCVAKTCARGQELNDDGDCEKIYVEPVVPKVKPKAVEQAKPKVAESNFDAIAAKCRRAYGSGNQSHAYVRITECVKNGGSL